MEKNQISKAQALAAYGGNQAALAKALGISRQAVHQHPEDVPVPELWELKLRYRLKPDVFGQPGDVAQADAAAKKAA